MEPGIDDISPVSVSQRVQREDPRQPVGFERVYEFVDADGRTRYARVNGAVHAVFDQAWYTSLGSAAVPAGTRFIIGEPPVAAERLPEARPAPNAVSLDAQPAGPNPAPARPSPSIVSNEFYRRARVSRWLAVAYAQR
ncbi:MAG: hypothetical protein AAGF47_01210 [Planctomycetota bacterium]